ncbi:hypothetical protein TFLX_06341 [Thermoflexales bacterium]|nr:hypothetical protein TFLX_06341 [Thermoflexales bacterium]
MKPSWCNLRELTLITLAYAVLTTLLTYPLLFQLDVGPVSHSSDAWILLWNNWWTQHALANGHSLFYTTNMFFPAGVSLAAHSFSFTHTLISALFAPFTSPIAAYNLAIWLIFPVAGLSLYILARDVTHSRAAAWIAGLIYAFAPYHLTQALGHPHLSYVQFIPLGVWGLLKAWRTSCWPYAVIAIGCFVLTAYAGPHLLVVTGAWLAIFIPLELLMRHQRVTRSQVGQLLVIGAGVAVLVLPLLLPAVSDMAQGQSASELQTGDFDNTQTDALAWLLPTRYHPVFGSALTPVYANLSKNNQWMPYLGYTALLLSICGIGAQRRYALSWLISGLFCLILALGTPLRFYGVTYTEVPLPFALLQNVFPFSFIRSPDRFNLIVSLPLALLAAFGVTAILNQITRQFVRGAITLGLSGLIAFEYLALPYPMLSRPPASPFMTGLAADSDAYAILDLPMGRNPSKLYLYWQTLHHKPLVEGHVSRTPQQAYDFIQNNALLQALQQPAQALLTEQQAAVARQQLCAQDVRYIIIHRSMVTAKQVAQYRALLKITPRYEDEWVIVFELADTGPGWPPVHCLSGPTSLWYNPTHVDE